MYMYKDVIFKRIKFFFRIDSQASYRYRSRLELNASVYERIRGTSDLFGVRWPQVFAGAKPAFHVFGFRRRRFFAGSLVLVFGHGFLVFGTSRPLSFARRVAVSGGGSTAVDGGRDVFLAAVVYGFRSVFVGNAGLGAGRCRHRGSGLPVSEFVLHPVQNAPAASAGTVVAVVTVVSELVLDVFQPTAYAACRRRRFRGITGVLNGLRRRVCVHRCDRQGDNQYGQNLKKSSHE